MAIEVRDAIKFYGSSKCDYKGALKGLNMDVKSNSIYCLLGPSGSGKSTILSCIVGTKKLNCGDIKVLGEPVGWNKSKIGYMPQELALIEEFSISELIYFFGLINGLSNTKVQQRLAFLLDLFELPDGNKLVKNCSGGQKRRISFAISMVHEPKMLVLDEPTVGFDPLLREKIWTFLTLSCRHMTVLITTHYIEEAKHADCVGLMRNGVLLIEEPPATILEKFATECLEEAFLKLCLKQESTNEGNAEDWNVTGTMTEVNAFDKLDNYHQKKHSTEAKTVLRALLMKNLFQIIRRPMMLAFLLFTPFLCLMSFFLAIGNDPKGLEIGIVSHEVNDSNECSNPLLLMAQIDQNNCHIHKSSCRFINQLNDSIAIKKFYNNYDDAFNDAKMGRIIGIIYFPSNFTIHEIQVYLDQTDRQITFILQRKLNNMFQNVMEQIMIDCGKSRRIGSIPIAFETIYGSFDDEMKRSMAPGIFITLYFFLAAMLTSSAFVNDRVDGIWDRTLLAGVRPIEILISHIITNMSIMCLQSIEFFIVSRYIYQMENRGNDITVGILIMLVGLTGIIYGLAVSILSKSFVVSQFLSTLIFYPMIIFCGIFWPLETIPWYFRYVAYLLPFTLPTISLRDILYKGYTIMKPSVLMGFATVILWIAFSLVICRIGLKCKKFCAK